MNLENFNQIAENYIAKFDLMNSDPHIEYFKWKIFKDFAKFREDFDSEEGISVEAFPERLKTALKNAGVIINTSTTWPATGIVKMAEFEPATVLQMFKDLYAEDGGNLEQRLERVWKFVGKVNELVDTYTNGSWKYKHSMKDVLTYLCLFYPEKNYMYQYTYADMMARALGFTDAVNYGQYFSLRNYYEMCDAIKKQMNEHDGLKAAHATIADHTEGVDDEVDSNIWVYDFIYCAKTYDLYQGVELMNFDKKSLIQREKELEKQAKIDKYTALISEYETSLAEYQQKADELPEVSIAGETVVHRKFGIGTVNQIGTRLSIDFEVGTKLFKLPDVIAQGFIKLDNDEVINICKEQFEINNKMKDLQKKIGFTEGELIRVSREV